MDRRIMKDHLDSLTDSYNSLMRGVRPSQSARELVSIMISSVCRLLPVQERDSSHFCCQSKDIIELAYITLSLVEKINSKLMSQIIMAPETSLYFSEIWREFQEKDLMSKLVQHFQAEDQMISHLAAKSVSTSVICELQNFDAVNPVWKQKCVEAFQNPCPCDELDACMWSFTNVLKTILKGSHESKTENLEKLLVAFNPALSTLFSKLLPEGEHKSVVYFSSTAGGTLSIFLDLLEVLNASRLICRTNSHLHCQRLVHTHTTALLRIVDSPFEYFVKKRVLLLLKRVLLQKAGEDMALGVLSSTELKDQHLCTDMTTLANGVLQTVDCGWLQCLPVKEASSFFGGTCQSHGTGGQQSDYVMLRAVSLVLVKSMEFRIQSDTGAGVDCAIDVNGYQQALLGFLRQHSVPLEERGHPCSWLTLVFGEQDDDMMEAAKALLLLFLYHSQFPGAYDAAASEKACASGSNPHCHFLLFLQSISFDHSILLDFLISTETCFLEYFVRYLKHLRADWEGFSLACQRKETVDPGQVEHSHPAPCCSGASALSREDGLPASTGPHLVQPEVGAPIVGGASKVRLVDYGSSEESDTDSMEVSEASQDTGLGSTEVAVCDGRLGGSSLKQGMSGLTVDTFVHMETDCRSSDLTAQVQVGSVFRQKRRIRETSWSSEMFVRTVLCLSELRRLVTRLHAKNLFPYNPTSLLKLLAHVETVKTSAWTIGSDANPDFGES